jgi:hypothetical protein
MPRAGGSRHPARNGGPIRAFREAPAYRVSSSAFATHPPPIAA